MKPLKTAALLAALPVALLCGCGVPENSAGVAPPAMARTIAPPQPAQPDVAGPINGIYGGASEQVEAKIPGCPYAELGLIEIGDRTLLFPYTTDLIYVAPVQADGTVHSQLGQTTLDGHLIDGRLAFSVTTPDCTSRFSFRRRSGF
jgi:hypothetical protein